jgi:hypothetical protein
MKYPFERKLGGRMLRAAVVHIGDRPVNQSLPRFSR